jgi:hypothetical protein
VTPNAKSTSFVSSKTRFCFGVRIWSTTASSSAWLGGASSIGISSPFTRAVGLVPTLT